MDTQYLNCMIFWRQRQRYYHGWAVKIINADDVIVVRFLTENYWLYALRIDRVYSPGSGRSLPVGTVDGVTEFYRAYAAAYRAAADALDDLACMDDIPAEIEGRGFTVVHPCTHPLSN